MSIDSDLLINQFQLMEKSRDKLEQSFSQCQKISLKTKLNAADEIAFEALTARFSRLSDYLVQRLFRTVDVIELDDSGTLRDRINRAEKKRWIKDANDFIEIRTLRNIIAHEYGDDEVITIYRKVMFFTPVLLEACKTVKEYIQMKEYIK